MALVRRIARPLLAAPFIYEGVQTALHPERSVDVFPEAFQALDSGLKKTSLPDFLDAETLLKAAGAVSAVAGLAYATNRAPRLAAVTLLATTTVGWAGRQRIWELDRAEQVKEIQAVLTDVGLLGGLLLAAVDTDGHPSLGYRMNKFVEKAQKNAAKKQSELEKKRAELEKRAGKGKKDLQKKAEKLRKDVTASAKDVRKKIEKQYA